MALTDVAAKSGYDVQIQTNHFGHFQLIKGLFPLLESAPSARIILHSSLARNGPKLQQKYFEKNSGGNLGGNGASMLFGGTRWKRYHMTKLANVVLMKALHDRLSAKNFTVIAVGCAPGLASTELQHTTHLDGGFSGYDFIWRFGQSAEDGSMPITHCCMSEDVSGDDFWEPKGGGPIKGPIKKINISKEKECEDVVARKWLWGKCEEAGARKVGSVKDIPVKLSVVLHLLMI